jgi:anaerobic selenocysteine-containing dehydrogenase
VFYASGHAGLEAAYLYALMARLHGNTNLPQSSNMCHKTTSVGLSKVIGSPVGTNTAREPEGKMGRVDRRLFAGAGSD